MAMRVSIEPLMQDLEELWSEGSLASSLEAVHSSVPRVPTSRCGDLLGPQGTQIVSTPFWKVPPDPHWPPHLRSVTGMRQVYFYTCFTLHGTLRQDMPGFLPRITESTRRRAGAKTLLTLFCPHLAFLFIRIKMIYVGHWIQGGELQFTHVRWLSLP